MYKILVPVDFSNTSKNALKYATSLFRGIELEITILHIYGAQSTALMMKSIDSILIKEAENQMSALVKEMEAEAPSVSFKTKLAKNYAISTISELGNSGIYDFIVMGTKGVSGLKEVFMGSVAGGVVSKTSAPVIVVPLDYNFKDLKQVVFAVGDNALSETSTLPLRKVLTLHKSQLEVLHISENSSPDFEVILSPIKDLNPKLTHKDGNGDLNQQLNVHVQNQDTDLLCLVRTKKDFFDRLFSGSVTLKQTFNSPIPILITHD
ncbi:universal stress protein [Winogradskyella sp.]|uniref:universal stress protein n=1 Tax=Winogradskyella sp. TaxID=1883156 RepID=UPI00262156D0|nr:universal stress protein [Winogradskyella sp.]